MTSEHPFERRPHSTFLRLSFPVMLSLIAEPLAGIVDTAFVERLGAASSAGLGAAAALLSGILWIFNFLGVGTQTEVAHGLGEGRSEEARGIASLAIVLAVALGVASALVAWIGLDASVAWMSSDPGVRAATRSYLTVRLVGFPAGLVLVAAFGALRGLQDMQTPLWIATAMSLLNVALDAVLIFGWGPFPALGIAGAAIATVVSQVGAAAWAIAVVARRLGWSWRFEWTRARPLFVVGRDMVIRTSMLLLFMILATRAALQMGTAAGAANQAMRQIWMLLAFLLDAYAATAQSLVAYFLGAGRAAVARKVAHVSIVWGVATGGAVTLALIAGEAAVALLLVPPESRGVFSDAWLVFALAQPITAVSFVTDGIHWGTKDYAYLRNAMLASSAVGVGLLFAIDPSAPRALEQVWIVTAVWIGIRAALGWARVWPGLGRAPLCEPG